MVLNRACALSDPSNAKTRPSELAAPAIKASAVGIAWTVVQMLSRFLSSRCSRDGLPVGTPSDLSLPGCLPGRHRHTGRRKVNIVIPFQVFHEREHGRGG